MSCSFGEKIKITIFGQSHSEAIGVVIDGLPCGIKIDESKIERFMQRRVPGQNSFSTKRKETDKAEIISGVVDGITCGAPVCALIKNNDTRSSDYDKLKYLPRPSHADFAAFFKSKGYNDIRGGGNFSGRMTAPLCFAGAVCMQLLEEKNIYVRAHIERIAGISDKRFDSINVSKKDFSELDEKDFPVFNEEIGEKMKGAIEKARLDSNSVGGVIECAVIGMPIGIGEPMFDGIENMISKAVFAVPAVKGIEFGAGFASADMTGEENNDCFTINDGKISTITNNHGGILGGLSSGMPIIFRVAIKPTPSIGKSQQSVNLLSGETETLCITGRHDPCIVPRAVACIEAACAVALINLI